MQQRVVLLAATSCILSACDRQPVEGPRVVELRAVADRNLGADNPKSEYYARFAAVYQLLVESPEHLSDALDYVVAAADDHSNGFAGFLEYAVFAALLRLDDREGLRRLLANVPLEVTGPDGVYIEYALVALYGDAPIDRFEVLFDAFHAARGELTKSHVAAAIRRAMDAEDDPALPDEVAIKRLRPKFGQLRHQVNVNPAYSEAYIRGFFDTSNTIPPPLFIPKDGPDRVEQRRK